MENSPKPSWIYNYHNSTLNSEREEKWEEAIDIIRFLVIRLVLEMKQLSVGSLLFGLIFSPTRWEENLIKISVPDSVRVEFLISNPKTVFSPTISDLKSLWVRPKLGQHIPWAHESTWSEEGKGPRRETNRYNYFYEPFPSFFLSYIYVNSKQVLWRNKSLRIIMPRSRFNKWCLYFHNFL